MKNIRKKSVFSLIINLSIIFFTFESTLYSFRSDVIHDPDWFGFEGIHSLRFFTVLSNIFVAIVAILFLVQNIKNIINDSYNCPEYLIVLKHCATTAVTVTFVTVALLLAPSYAIIGKGYFTLFFGNHIYMHFLNPILAILSFILLECSHKVTFKKSLYALLPVILYAILYTTMVIFVGEANGGWPDFYNFTFGGHNWVIPLSIIGMLLLTFMISLLLTKWHNRNCNRQE